MLDVHQAIENLLGDYAQTAPPDTFLVKQGNGINNGIAKLRGSRFVAAVETEEGRRLAEVLVKQVTGGDRIACRFLYQEHFEYSPSYKIFIATNHKPEIRGNDDGIWRRIKVVKFGVTIPEAEVDPHLSEKLKAELSGILTWAVRGCQEWQKSGLGCPEEVRAASLEYRDECDTLKLFLEDCCELGSAMRETASHLYRAYQQWCKSNGETAWSQKTLAKALQTRNFKNHKGTGGTRCWLGLKVVYSM